MPGAWHAFASELSAFFERAGRLAQLDALLLKAELKQSGIALMVAIGALVGAVVLGFCGLAVLAGSAGLFLVEQGMRPSLAALSVVLLLAILAAALAFFAIAKFQNWTLKPERTFAQVKLNLEALKASLQDEPRLHS